MSNPIVIVEDVYKSYLMGKEAVPALRGVSLNIESKEFVCLMGPSGSGKTTLLNIIGGLDEASLGHVIVEGQNLVALSENKLALLRLNKMGFIFQNYNLLANFTAHENVEAPLVLAKKGRRERKERAQALLVRVGLADRAHHYPSELSGGQQQRVAIARIGVDQAQRALADAQEAYDTAFDPGRDWEYHITEPSCLPGQGDPISCTGLSLHLQMKAEREGATRSLEYAQENLEVARAQYSLGLAGLNNDTALNAQANVVSAQQALEQAQTGPKPSEIAAARLRLEQSELSLQQSRTSLEQAQSQLSNTRLLAPWRGTILTVEVSPGALVGAGAAIVTLLDTENLQFHTSNLSERDLAQIELGQPAEITLKAYLSQPVVGKVSRIAPQAEGTVGDAAFSR